MSIVPDVTLVVAVAGTGLALFRQLYLDRQLLRLQHYKLDTILQQGSGNVDQSLTVELLERQSLALRKLARRLGNEGIPQPSYPSHALLRELQHSLSTPLAQVDAAAALIRERSEQGLPPDPTAAERIATSVDICRAFLSAFGQVATVEGTWDAESFRSSAAAAALVYDDHVDGSEHHQFDINLPDHVDGYRTTSLLAVILPLIENAVEAGPAGTTVEVGYHTSGDAVTFTVTNTFIGQLPSDMYLDGITTKQGHAGTGLAVVHRVLIAQDGALTHELSGDRITFVVTLPRRAETVDRGRLAAHD